MRSLQAVTPKANFEDANLSDVLMDRAVMNEANLKNAVLQRAIFTRSDLTGAIVEGADFSNALLDKTQQLVCQAAQSSAVLQLQLVCRSTTVKCGVCNLHAACQWPSQRLCSIAVCH